MLCFPLYLKLIHSVLAHQTLVWIRSFQIIKTNSMNSKLNEEFCGLGSWFGFFLFFFPKPWDCSSWFNYKIWVCFIPSSSDIFGKPHFRQQWGLVQERSLWSSLKFWTEGFLANGKERNKDASLIAGCPWAGASVGLSAAGLVWIQLCLVRSRWTLKHVKQSTSCAACPGAPGLP